MKACKQRPSLISRYYAVLATVSRGCSPPVGTFLFITHPCATLLASEETFSFDLHVLSTPPAFVLSQDQTLTFKSFINHLMNKMEYWLFSTSQWLAQRSFDLLCKTLKKIDKFSHLAIQFSKSQQSCVQPKLLTNCVRRFIGDSTIWVKRFLK